MKKIAKFIITIFIYIFEKILNILDNPDDFDPHKHGVKSYNYYMDKNFNMIDDIINYMNEQKIDEIIKLFSKEELKDNQLNNRIEELVMTYKKYGQVKSINNKSFGISSSEVRERQIIYQASHYGLDIEFENKITLHMMTSEIDICDENPNEIGVTGISLKDTAKNKYVASTNKPYKSKY